MPAESAGCDPDAQTANIKQRGGMDNSRHRFARYVSARRATEIKLFAVLRGVSLSLHHENLE
jgi:hypothetical protein